MKIISSGSWLEDGMMIVSGWDEGQNNIGEVKRGEKRWVVGVDVIIFNYHKNGKKYGDGRTFIIDGSLCGW